MARPAEQAAIPECCSSCWLERYKRLPANRQSAELGYYKLVWRMGKRSMR